MNTEIFDYIKALSKKEFFFVNFFNCVFSATIIVCGFISVRYEATMELYATMFASATLILTLNSYKCFKRGSKNGWVFAVLAVAFLAITAIAVYACLGGR